MVENIIDNFIEKCGFQKFGCILLAIVCGVWFIDGTEVAFTSLLAPTLRCEWALNGLQTSLMSAATFLGMGLGSVFVGWISDIHGRRIVLLYTLALILYFSSLSIFADDYLWFCLLRLFNGIGLSGVLMSPCYITEFFGSKYRARAIIILTFTWSFSFITASFIAYFLLNLYGWKVYLLINLIPVPLILISSFWLPESIRYLQTTGEYNQIMKTVHRISKINNIPLPKQLNSKIVKTKNNKETICKDHLSTVITSMVLFVSCFIVQYSFNFISAELTSICYSVSHGTNKILCNKNDNTAYYQAFLSSISSIIAPFICILLAEYIGRKTIIYISAIISIASIIPLSFCLPSYISTGILMVARPTSNFGLIICWLLVGETFPTSMRGTVFGLCNTAGRWSLILVPFLIQWLMHYSIGATTAILVASCIVQMICVYLMPYETFGKIIKE